MASVARFLVRRRPTARHLCSAASSAARQTRATPGNQPLVADEQALWVSYADPASLRRQLVGVAQQVRECMDCDPLPDIIMPKADRVRHGFFFMHFQETTHRDAAIEALQGQAFQTACGSFAGTLQFDVGDRTLDARCMLNIPRIQPDPIEAWLRKRFGMYGTITSLALPRLRNNWDGGLAFIRFSHPDEADDALEALDGTPSPIAGCNMFIDYQVAKPLRTVVDLPGDGAMTAPPHAE